MPASTKAPPASNVVSLILSSLFCRFRVDWLVRLGQPALAAPVVLDVVEAATLGAAKVEFLDVGVLPQRLRCVVHDDATALDQVAVRDDLERRHGVLLNQ